MSRSTAPADADRGRDRRESRFGQARGLIRRCSETSMTVRRGGERPASSRLRRPASPRAARSQVPDRTALHR